MSLQSRPTTRCAAGGHRDDRDGHAHCRLVAGVAPDVQWAHGHATVGGREATAADITSSTEIQGAARDSGTVLGERMFATYGAAGGINISINFWMEADNDDRSYGLDIFGTQGPLRPAAERGHAPVPSLWLAHVAGLQPPVGTRADDFRRRAGRLPTDQGGRRVTGCKGSCSGSCGRRYARTASLNPTAARSGGDGEDARGLGIAPAPGAGGPADGGA